MAEDTEIRGQPSRRYLLRYGNGSDLAKEAASGRGLVNAGSASLVGAGMIELYRDHNAVCCQKVELVLAEKDISWVPREISLPKGEQLDPDFLKINPNAVVPVLVHDGIPVVESTVICEYLDEVFPEPVLHPADPLGRAHMRLWTKHVDEALHEAGSVLSFATLWGDRFRKLSLQERQRRYRNVGDPIREDMYESTVEHGLDSPYVKRAAILFERAFANLESELLDGAEWATGARFTLADTALTPYVARLEYLGVLDLWLDGRPRTGAWWERVKTRASFEAAIGGTLSVDDIAAMRATGERLRPHIRSVREDTSMAVR